MVAACYTKVVSDPNVLKLVEAAVAAQPDNRALRLHYAQLLLDEGQAEASHREAKTILDSDPTHIEALTVAAHAAHANGDEETATGYRNLLAVLKPTAGGRPPDGGRDETPDRIRTPASVPVDGGAPNEIRSPASVSVDDGAPNEIRSPASVSVDDGASNEGGPARVAHLRVFDGGDEAANKTEANAPITFADVVGMAPAKERLELSFLGPLRNPELRAMYKKSLRGGLLLYGPPGCGKTHLARACAGELNARFVNIGISDVLDMWLGESERRLHELFEQARRQAPCVLFLDEVDALGHKRTQLKNSAGRTLVNQLLQELDSVQSSNEGVFVLAATNHPWDLDTALRRPGRLDRTVLVPPPDEEARAGILDLYLEDRPSEGIDTRWVARRTKRFSGADLAHLVDSAAELALADAIRAGKPRSIEQRDMKAALKNLRPSTEAWLQTARNFATYANEGGAYDDLLAWLRAN